MRLATYDFGGSGPPVVFAHATGFHAHVWLPVVECLRERFHCFGFDQRAHGDSDAPGDDGFEWDRLGADVLTAVAALDLDTPFGVGHSSGSAALLLAEEARPATFRALWLYEPVVVPVDDPPPPSDNGMAAAARRRRDVFPSREAAYENYASKPPFASLAPAALRAFVDHGFTDVGDGSVRLKCRPDNEARFYMTQASHGAYRDLAAVHCPVTIAHGDPEASLPATFAPALVARLADAAIERIHGATHFGPLEQPAAIAASIERAFIGR